MIRQGYHLGMVVIQLLRTSIDILQGRELVDHCQCHSIFANTKLSRRLALRANGDAVFRCWDISTGGEG